MRLSPTSPRTRAVLVLLGLMAAGHLAWEFAHVPLYTLWLTGSGAEIVWAVLHCTIGDVMIANFCLGAAILLFGRKGWPDRGYRRVAVTMIVLALAYTIFSEWLNVEVRQSWAYRDLMPRLPWLGTGLTPVLQWIVIPGLAFFLLPRFADVRVT